MHLVQIERCAGCKRCKVEFPDKVLQLILIAHGLPDKIRLPARRIGRHDPVCECIEVHLRGRRVHLEPVISVDQAARRIEVNEQVGNSKDSRVIASAGQRHTARHCRVSRSAVPPGTAEGPTVLGRCVAPS